MEIQNSDIEKRYRVQIDTRETLVYKLKDGKYCIDSGLYGISCRTDKPNFGSKLDLVKPISENEANELIEAFQKKREKYGQAWLDPKK